MSADTGSATDAPLPPPPPRQDPPEHRDRPEPESLGREGLEPRGLEPTPEFESFLADKRADLDARPTPSEASTDRADPPPDRPDPDIPQPDRPQADVRPVDEVLRPEEDTNTAGDHAATGDADRLLDVDPPAALAPEHRDGPGDERPVATAAAVPSEAESNEEPIVEWPAGDGSTSDGVDVAEDHDGGESNDAGASSTDHDEASGEGPARSEEADAPVQTKDDPTEGAREVRGRHFPETAGSNETLVKRDNDGNATNYQIYDAEGKPVRRVDLVGRPHGGVETPHVHEYERHINPHTGETFVRKSSEARAARPDEIPPKR